MLKEFKFIISKNIIKFLLLSWVFLNGQSLVSSEKFYASDSEITLISETYAIRKGDEILIGIKFELEEGWHTYWENPGDAGEGATIDWVLPKGLKASEILWPGPERIPVDPLMTFGYNDEVVLLTRITSDEELTFPAKIQANVSWFTCKDICIPQEGNIDVVIQQGDFSSSIHSKEIRSYLNKVPTEFPQNYIVQKLDDKFFIQSDVDNGKHFQKVYFFPKVYGLTNFVKEQIYEKNQNSFVLEIEASRVDLQMKSFEGVLETYDGQKERFYEISYPLETSASDQNQSIILLIIFAFLGGLILNIMPCVFPILSIKILRFVEHSENSSAQTYKFGIFYALGSILSFLLIATALISLKSSGENIGWGFQLQYPLVISVLFYLFIALGYMFMSDLVFGSRLGQLSSLAQVKNESLESFLTGVLAVVVASPCTAPFMGSAIGFALLQPSANSFLIFFSLGLGFALPYLILSLKPSLLSFLPKPGQWMETFKQFMAFPMWASALWLLWVLSGQVDSDTVLLVLIGGLAISLALWLLEKNTTSLSSIKWLIRLLAALLIFISLLILPTEYSSDDQANENELLFTEDLLQEYLDNKQLVFLNFTADWCITCKVNERVALKSTKVLALMNAKNIKYIEADWTRKDAVIAKKLEEYGRTGVPLYLLYSSKGEPIILPEILTEDILLGFLNELS
tara:strand:- start:8838 stop:10892 length:2055 start_codon:yes stop_codon:yes gene_type:complete